MNTPIVTDNAKPFATKAAFAGDAEIFIAEGFFTPEKPR
jgi:hypothetical protein